MDEDAVLTAIGEFRADIRTMGREIRDLKAMLECKDKDCEQCRREINGEIALIKTTHTGEAAVKSWKDKTLGEVATSIGAGAGLVALIAWFVRGIVTGVWF